MSADFDPGDWRPVPNIPRFEINCAGRVRHAGTKRERSTYDSNGYLLVRLENRKYRVHRLVALAFLPTDPTRPHVNHKDGVKTNNHVKNLEWVSHTENVRHAVSMGLTPAVRRGEEANLAKLTSGQVARIRSLRASGRKLRSLAKEFGVSKSLIWAISKREIWTHVG